VTIRSIVLVLQTSSQLPESRQIIGPFQRRWQKIFYGITVRSGDIFLGMGSLETMQAFLQLNSSSNRWRPFAHQSERSKYHEKTPGEIAQDLNP